MPIQEVNIPSTNILAQGQSGISGISGFPVFQSVWLFRLSVRSGCLGIPAFRSFGLSGRSGFLVVLADRAFWLSGRSSRLVVPAVLSFWQFSGQSSPCKQKDIKKGEAHQTKKGNKLCKGKQQVHLIAAVPDKHPTTAILRRTLFFVTFYVKVSQLYTVCCLG